MWFHVGFWDRQRDLSEPYPNPPTTYTYPDSFIPLTLQKPLPNTPFSSPLSHFKRYTIDDTSIIEITIEIMSTDLTRKVKGKLSM